MLLFLIAYLGGVLTIVSPCILPVLPFLFARADRFVPAERPADAGRHGTDVCGRRHTGRGRRWPGR